MGVVEGILIFPILVRFARYRVSQSDHTAIVGLQWGDEGKGKIVDLLSEEHDVVVRYNGGANAGHTVVHGGERYALHLLPSGILRPETICVVGNGVVLDPAQILKECDEIRRRGITVNADNLRISNRAHIVMPWHKTLDAVLEKLLSEVAGRDHSIGTTKRGIGPAYADKIHRATAIRMGDLLDRGHLRERLEVACTMKNAQLQAYDPGHEPFAVEALFAEFAEYGATLRPLVCDTTYLLHALQSEGKRFLFEGANACLLDIDHGTFPYVTSSNCSTLGIPAGTGLPGKHVQKVLGIVKAYSTRVGGGPFPTEITGPVGARIRERGHEFGTTTGRPRRCGWLDLVAVKYSALICGATAVAVMLFDVLAGFAELKLCTAYEVEGYGRTECFLPDAHLLKGAVPVFETLPGFTTEITAVRSLADLPSGARDYLDRIAEYLEIPVEIVSVGPDRRQTILG